LSALGKLINGKTAGFSVMNFDLQQMEKNLPIVKTDRFEILSFSERKPSHSDDSSFKERIKSIPKVEAKKELISIVLEAIANILGLQMTELNENRPFREYGMDSLMGFDLAMYIEKRTCINMSSIAFHRIANAKSIADLLLSKILGGSNEADEDQKSIFLKKHGESSNNEKKDSLL